MEIAAAESVPEQQPSCWCCGTPFEDSELTRLGEHPEVGVCAGCAHWLYRRARLGADRHRRAPTAVLRRGVHRTRGAVIRLGAPDWPVLGPLLRRLDRHLP